MRALALLTVGLIAAGCYDLSRTLPGNDTTGPDSAPGDSTWRDGPLDARRLDLPLDATPPADAPGPMLDGPLPDRALMADKQIAPPLDTLLSADMFCVLKSEINPSAPTCNQQCVSAANDADCDGLPGARDPWPTGCNKLTLAEGFDKVLADTATWNTTTGATWTCGQVDLGAGDSLSLGNLAPLAVTRFFVEVKLTLGAITNSTKWGVKMNTAVMPGWASYGCELWVNSSYQPTPGLHLSNACSGTWTSGSDYPASPGTTYFLQAYYTSSAGACRLLDANGALVASKALSICMQNPAASKALSVTASGRAATIHHIRVFEAP